MWGHYLAQVRVLPRLALSVIKVCFAVSLCGGALTLAHGQDQPPPAQTVELLLTTAPGAPTPEEIVDYYAHPFGVPPLHALLGVVPIGARYFVPERAEGDFLAWLQAHPDSVRAQLERYLVLTYAPGANVDLAVAALQADPFVAAAYRSAALPLTSTQLIGFGVDQGDGEGQYGRTDLNIDAAWQIASGYSLIAQIDSGLYVNHSALAQFSTTGQYLGGNFIPSLSEDLGNGVNDSNVDELRTGHVSDPVCNPNNIPQQAPTRAGHGTHVAGLISANGASLGVLGVCKHCGVAMRKVTYPGCNENDGQVEPVTDAVAQAAALMTAGDFGAQIVNMSFGSHAALFDTCRNMPTIAMCEAISYASHRDIVMVASAGNGRTALYFPARDTRVVPAGGFQEDLQIWDLYPNCPPFPYSGECGSNYTNSLQEVRQEVMGSAQSVLSTTYPYYNWVPEIKCGDQFPNFPAWGGGVGWCTGTSMSAPQISGVMGILRSINPLVPTGVPPISPGATLRYVLASTTFEAQAGQPWDPHMGYGYPDAALAAHTMLGKVARVYIRNRATPLFRLYSSGNSDYADTTSPQLAVALMINAKSSWQPPSTIPTVPYYSTFPHDPTDGTLAAPRASVYVLTTEFQPRAEWPMLLPLYLMDKDYGSTGKDFMLTTSTTEIVQAHTSGYNLRTIQGYIYKPCTPEPNCIPPGAQKFWREFKASINDCATFLESERTTFESAGYTGACPAGSTKMIGYAYPATDSDGDGLPDGFEYVVGTSPTRADSDGDGVSDGVEFPMVSTPVSDPCNGGTGALYCGANVIFKNGFDPL